MASSRKPVAKPARVSKRLAPAALRRVKLLLCDVDGILTDASIFMGGGVEYKRFHIRDGLGLRLLQKNGIKVGWVSARPSGATTQRAEDLKIDYLHQSSGRKVEAVEAILKQAGVTWAEVCYMGDDIVDLGVLRRAGVAVTVPEAIVEARELSHYVTRLPGGHGAVREVVDLILKAQGKWDALVEDFRA
ncbi:MAG TPA: HAD hydrolase family protein [Verrucomicrobiae bacterium]|nr:HAD hydrolase family protein [Verrucomicrobiae bacterium]